MDRMKTFFLYLLVIIGFMFLSYVLENSLLENMYEKMTGSITSQNSDISIDEVSGKASNVNGYLQIKVSNNSSYPSGKKWIKLDLYSKRGLLGLTKYIEVSDIEPGATKEYQIKFKGSEIRKYEMAMVDELPDKANIISILGWEIDLTNVFGMDLSQATFLGVKLTDLFSWDGVATAGGNAWNWIVQLLSSVPWWGYAIGAGLIIWYMPKGYLFGIFPF